MSPYIITVYCHNLALHWFRYYVKSPDIRYFNRKKHLNKKLTRRRRRSWREIRRRWCRYCWIHPHSEINPVLGIFSCLSIISPPLTYRKINVACCESFPSFLYFLATFFSLLAKINLPLSQEEVSIFRIIYTLVFLWICLWSSNQGNRPRENLNDTLYILIIIRNVNINILSVAKSSQRSPEILALPRSRFAVLTAFFCGGNGIGILVFKTNSFY